MQGSPSTVRVSWSVGCISLEEGRPMDLLDREEATCGGDEAALGLVMSPSEAVRGCLWACRAFGLQVRGGPAQASL